MKLPARHLIALPVLLAFVPTLTTVFAAGIQPAWHNREPHHHQGDGYVLPFLKRLRDSAIELILGPPSSTRAKAVWTDFATVHSRYQNDVVIRFNVTNPEEEASLSTAAFQMLLDVWAFTPEYVDIRINKKYLPSLLKLLPSSLQPAFLISDVVEAAWATYPSKTLPLSSFDHSTGGPAKMNMLIDGTDNIFFSDYQPLIVSLSPCLPGLRLTLTPRRSLQTGCACSRLSSLLSPMLPASESPTRAETSGHSAWENQTLRKRGQGRRYSSPAAYMGGSGFRRAR